MSPPPTGHTASETENGAVPPSVATSTSGTTGAGDDQTISSTATGANPSGFHFGMGF